VEWLKAPEQTGLRRAFTVWLNRVFLPKQLPGVEFESMTDLHEVRNMLSDRVESWTDQWKREGLKQGLEQSRQETRHLLTRLAHRRFGPTIAAQAEPLLTAVSDPLRLEDLGDALLSCPDGTAWLRILHQAQPMPTAGDGQP